MALPDWFEGFDPYDTVSINSLVGAGWVAVGGSGNDTISTTGQRTGRACASFTQSKASQKAFNTAGNARVFFGAAMSQPTGGGQDQTSSFTGCGIECNTTGNIVRVFGKKSSGFWTVYRNGVELALVVSNKQFFNYAYAYVMIDYNNTTGAVKVWIDRTLICDTTITTLGDQTMGEFANRIHLGRTASNTWVSTCYYDDVFCASGLSNAQTDKLTSTGDYAVEYIYPDANGATQNWSFTGGATAWQSINIAPPDVTTPFDIEAAAVNDVSNFATANPTFTAQEIVGLKHQYFADKTDAGGSSVQASILSGATPGAGADNPVTTTPTYYEDVYTNDPATGLPWTPASLDGIGVSFDRTV